jgi:L-lactate dehydrogenase complex protein LldE
VRVALFATCLADALFPQAAQATVVLLERLGHEVVFPQGQTCCGQMHINTGYQREALPLIRHHVDVFEAALRPNVQGGLGAQVVVAPSGSCVGSVRHQQAPVAAELARQGSAELELAGRAQAVAARTFELSEFLVDVLGLTDVGARFPHRVTYHPTCHSLRMLRVDDKPLRLLRSVAGLELVELPAAEQCCGFGGTFALKNSAVSAAMLADKVRHVQATGARVVTAGDSSCLMHIGGGLSRLRIGVRTVHLAQILAGEGWEASL